MELIGWCSVAGTAHFIVHFLLLVYLVPKLGLDLEDENYGMQYKAVAESEARSFFSCNPVHCLRTKYIHGSVPHCRPCAWGKEHLLEKNEKIGCYFKGEAAEVESFDVRKSFSGLTRGLSKEEDDPKEASA